MQTQDPTKFKELLRGITVFFYATIGGVLIFSLLVLLVSQKESLISSDKNLMQVFLVVNLFIAAISLSIGEKIYRKRLTFLRSANYDLMEKLDRYRSALIIYMATCEGPAILAIIFYFMTANKLFLIIVGVLLIAMFLKRPEKSKIFNDLQLSAEEQTWLN